VEAKNSKGFSALDVASPPVAATGALALALAL